MIVLLDGLTVAFFLAALIPLWQPSQRSLDTPLKILLTAFLSIGSGVGLSNFLEHGGLGRFFDPIEDHLEILLPPTFLYFMASYLSSLEIRRRGRVEEESRLKIAAIEAAVDGIAILDAEGRYLFLNRAHARIYGFKDAAELTGRSWRDLYEEQEIKRFETDILPLVRRQGHWRGEATGRMQDETSFPQEVSLTLLPEGLMICVVRDIRRRKKREREVTLLNEQLSQANTELKSFSYSLSHDLRNLLTRLSLSAQTLNEQPPSLLGDQERYCVENIMHVADAMEELVQAMLVLSRATSNEMIRQPVDLSGLAEEVLAELKLQEFSRRVDVAIAPNLKAIGDPKLLRVLLQNLLGNAWKYTGTTPEARIEFRKGMEKGETVFCVIDNGVGFPAAESERMFQPFQRLHDTAEFPGTGVGLATVRRIVQRHGGRVWAEGRVGEGASIYFTLPS